MIAYDRNGRPFTVGSKVMVEFTVVGIRYRDKNNNPLKFPEIYLDMPHEDYHDCKVDSNKSPHGYATSNIVCVKG